MAWFRVNLTDDEQRIVNDERESHPDQLVRRKMFVLWSLHCGLQRQQAAQLAQVGLATVQRYVAAYRTGGLDGLRQSDRHGPVSELANWRETIRQSFAQQPVSSIAAACVRIKQLTGLQRGPTQVRKFLKGLGLKWQRLHTIPVPPKKTWPSMSLRSASFTTHN